MRRRYSHEDGELDEEVVASEADNDNAPAADDDDPLPEDTIPAKWVTEAMHNKISASLRTAPNFICGQCGEQRTSRKRLLCHARVHLVHSCCRCRYDSKWREAVRKHQRDERNGCDKDDPVYKGDRVSYDSWRGILQLPAMPYPGEHCGGRHRNTPPTPAEPTHTPVQAPSRAPPAATVDVRHMDAGSILLAVSVLTSQPRSKSKKHKSKDKTSKRDRDFKDGESTLQGRANPTL